MKDLGQGQGRRSWISSSVTSELLLRELAVSCTQFSYSQPPARSYDPFGAFHVKILFFLTEALVLSNHFFSSVMTFYNSFKLKCDRLHLIGDQREESWCFTQRNESTLVKIQAMIDSLLDGVLNFLSTHKYILFYLWQIHPFSFFLSSLSPFLSFIYSTNFSGSACSIPFPMFRVEVPKWELPTTKGTEFRKDNHSHITASTVYWASAYYMLGTMLGVFHAEHLILMTTQGGWKYYSLFPDRKTEAPFLGVQGHTY